MIAKEKMCIPPDVGPCPHGAPMGRTSSVLTGEVHIQPMQMVDGDYDVGGAYWGGGDAKIGHMFVAEDSEGAQAYVRAASIQDAMTQLQKKNKNILGITFPQDLDFEEFFKHYLVAALWSTSDESDNEHENLDGWASIHNFMPEALEVLRAHCMSFWSQMHYLIDSEEEDARARQTDGGIIGHAGHDFWMTHNGHGVGYWDGDWPKHGETFTKLSHNYPEINLYGENGKVGIM